MKHFKSNLLWLLIIGSISITAILQSCDSPEDDAIETPQCMRIIYNDGRVLKNQQVMLHEGKNEYNVNTQNWLPGLYSVVVDSKIGMVSETLIK